MNKTNNLIWILLLILILLPTTAGRFIIDIAGGLMIFFLTLPIFLGGLGWLGWKLIQNKMITCEICGTTSFNQKGTCPMCGKKNGTSKNSDFLNSNPASSATIDITAEDVDSDI